MIVVKLMGGLGNQMFQYAAGRALAEKHKVELFVDESFLFKDPGAEYTKRFPELDQLNVKYNKTSAQDIELFSAPSLLKKLFNTKNTATVLNEQAGVCSEYFNVGSTVYLNGYWQSEIYFELVREMLLKEFTPRYNLQALAGAYLKQILDCKSVSVHIRRGDYVQLKSAGEFHGALEMSYYNNAMEWMKSNYPDCHFFIFSDDPGWCRQNFKDDSTSTIVETGKTYSSADMMLMKQCHHNIIANSSYSWWGAWLNTHPGQTVIAPKKWFRQVEATTIYAKNWKII